MSARAALALLLALCASGCDELNLPKSWALAYPRVLGMRSEVVGDETRATPEPGEQVRVRVLIAGREPIGLVTYSLLACPTVPSNGELPSCTGKPFEQVLGMQGQNGELTLELDLPDEDALEGFAHVLVAGAACIDSELTLADDGSTPECEGSDEPALTWSGTIALARDDDEHNANPELPDDAIAFDDDTWTASGSADEEPALRVKADGKLHVVRVRLQDSGRERVDGAREELLLTHFSSAGALQRRFSVLEASDPNDKLLSVEWRSPKPLPDMTLPAEAKLVFVLRDQRGGVAFTERRLALDRE